MKRGLFALFILLFAVVFFTGCSSLPSGSVKDKPMPEIIPPAFDVDEWGGADLYDNSGDNPESRYYVNPNFYGIKSDDQLLIIDEFKTFQQTTEWSCGPASALMVLWHFGIKDYNEWDIAVAMKSHTDMDTPGAEPGTAKQFGEYGTSVEKMYNFLSAVPGIKVVETSFRSDYSSDEFVEGHDSGYAPPEWGNLPNTFSAMSLYTTDNDDASENWVEDAADSYFISWLTGHLSAGRPIMVEWADWGGHWQVIIGYDNNGTPGLGDDIIIFADPYDTSDHWQDGYYYYPLERWFYMWNDTRIAPKPFQLQPFIIIDKK